MLTKNKLPLLLLAYGVILTAYAIFSYSLTDLNLVLTPTPTYWNFQQFMWTTFFHNARLLTFAYVLFVGLLFTLYFSINRLLRTQSIGNAVVHGKHLLLYGAVILPLVFSYNALSHDVFNYMFNARMVVKYGANPHVRTAIEFAAFDDWTRFMHNTHTPAPYGYGWTALSLIPSVVGGGRFLPTWLAFRLFSLGSVLLTFAALAYAQRVLYNKRLTLGEVAVFFLNPLVVIELIGNAHNDLWMMAPAVFAFALQVHSVKLNSWRKVACVVGSAALLAASASIKLATVALVPLWLLLLIGQKQTTALEYTLVRKLHLPVEWAQAMIERIVRHVAGLFPFLASVLLFLPLFTARSQQFLPWYLVWSLVWLPLGHAQRWRSLLMVMSVAAMLRYLPWLLAGGYSEVVHQQELLITWLLPLIYLLFESWRSKRWSRARNETGNSSLKRIE